MASDPSQLLLQIANAPGLAAQSVFQGANDQLARQKAQQQMQFNGLKMAALKQDQAQQQQYDQDVQAYFADPSPASLSNLITRYPQQADALKKGWDVKDDAVRRADMGQFGAIYSALSNKKPALAVAQLKARREAERKQGIDTSELDQYIDALESGDESAAKTVQGYALAQIAAGDRDKFSEIFKTVGGDRGSKVVGPGAALVDGEGKELYKAPFAPRPVTVGEGDTVVEYQPGGGGPASGGGSSGAYTGGWTPRARNGGDNNDAAVDGKIAGAAQYLGVGPGDDISGLSPMKIAQAMTLSEGGPGSIADRNNNPGNLRNGDGSFKKFPTKEAGLRAAAALVSRKLRNGQTTVTSLIEGVPQSGGGGGSRVIAQGAPKPGYHLMTPEENQAAGLDPNVRYQRSPDGQITALGGQSKAQLKPVPAPIVTKVLDNRKAVRNIDGALAEVAKYPNGVGFGTGGFGLWDPNRTDPKGTEVRSAIANIGSLLIHDRSGAAVTIAETPRLVPFIPQITDSAPTAKKKLARLRAEIASLNEDYEAQYSEDQGYKPIAASPSAAPVRVRSMQEAQKLAPGTVYVAPNGKRYRR